MDASLLFRYFENMEKNYIAQHKYLIITPLKSTKHYLFHSCKVNIVTLQP